MIVFLEEVKIWFPSEDLAVYSKMGVCVTSQHDRRVKFLAGQEAILAGHCPLTSCYFESCLARIKQQQIGRTNKKKTNPSVNNAKKSLSITLSLASKTRPDTQACQWWHIILFSLKEKASWQTWKRGYRYTWHHIPFQNRRDISWVPL